MFQKQLTNDACAARQDREPSPAAADDGGGGYNFDRATRRGRRERVDSTSTTDSLPTYQRSNTPDSIVLSSGTESSADDESSDGRISGDDEDLEHDVGIVRKIEAMNVS